MESVPCGRVLGHGESCVHGNLCVHCARILELEQIIINMRHEKSKAYPDGCWCGACKNDPNLGGRHLPHCLLAQEAMKGVE